MNNLKFFTNNKIYFMTVIFIIYYISKLYTHYRNNKNFNYKIIDIIYKKYKIYGLIFFGLIILAFALFLTNVGVKIIN